MKILKEDTIYQILAVVDEIPYGKVPTYGQIAKLIGQDNHSRLVGKVLSMSSFYGDYPCHRVVNHQGRLVPSWKEQRELLKEENIEVKENGCVDIKKYGWKI